MSEALVQDLQKVLDHIDRPGSFCVSGSASVVLPGLEVAGLGPISLPLTPSQATELKKHCEQAPYGKGEETIVDTSVRRVWRLTPKRFTLTNPEWGSFLEQTVAKVQEELGLEEQKLACHLYDLLLYEPGSFFLPHRDGEKLDRMVATLIVTLPSSFQGGELVVRHDGQEQTIDFGGDSSPFHIHFAAFYADCEHEVRPLREGHRLSLVYNLTLARSKKHLTAPRHAEPVERIGRLLAEWPSTGGPRKVVITLDHQYTPEGLAWDALKGVDRARARALRDGARQAGCQALLGLLTLHESGSAEDDGGGYRGRGRWYGGYDDASDHEMGEIYETTLNAEHLIDADGQRLTLPPLAVAEDEVLDPDALKDVEPREEFEGYTGNEGMTLDRWYQHAAVFLWPNQRHFDILCDAGGQEAVAALAQRVSQWRKAGKKTADALRTECLTFAATIIARWSVHPYYHPGLSAEKTEESSLFLSLAALGDAGLVKAYLRDILPKDATVDPGKTLATVCHEHGWETFQPELETAFQQTTAGTLARNVRLLEHLCLGRSLEKAGWSKLCEALAQSLVAALEGIDRGAATAQPDWYREPHVDRAPILAGLARSLLATGQKELLSRLVEHALALPKKYPLREAHVMALTALQPWLGKHGKKAPPALSHWLASCRTQLEALTAQEPQPPADYRREAHITCTCADCAELKRFLHDPQESVHRFRAAEARRRHLEHEIGRHLCDLDLKTERTGSPHTLVATKNTASYNNKLKTYHQDQERLAAIQSLQAKVRK